MADLVDKATLKTLVPPSALNAENFQELAGKTYVEVVPPRKAIFKQGDVDKKKVYLLEGEVTLTNDSGQKSTIKAGTPAAKHPLGNQLPRKHTAIANVPCRVTRIDTDLLDILLTWDQLSGIEVDEIQEDQESDEEGGDWMTRILQSKAFLQVPPANIQAMFMRIQEVSAKAGETIIKQGDDGDYYYIIKSGRCKVTRTSKANTQLTLATLKEGDAFGEEALLSDAKRNANIVMETDGSLMRLSKEDFNSLLKEPMLSWVTNEQAEQMVKDGAVWMDVRLESEYKNNGIPGSVNLPLFMLRMKADTLDPNKKYILYCDTGRRSSAGAFLLSERGLQAYCLKDGLQARGS
ncbi:MAG TPA: cyclic nucleotide-binding domain-containing protein [Gammaproteobacteria bacterium]|nr:cyclic nucleotide-binding domain-containing protein [Gammaproteobacteria bacterium]